MTCSRRGIEVEGVWYVDGLEHIQVRVFLIVASCFRASFMLDVDEPVVVDDLRNA